MKTTSALSTAKGILLACLLMLVLGAGPAHPAAAQTEPLTGGAAFHSLPPDFVCVGDSFQFQAAASTDWPDFPPDENGNAIPLAPLPVTVVQISAELGAVTPAQINEPSDFVEFSFTYTAKRAGTETITLNVDNGLAKTIERFEVHEKCDYDAYLLTIMHLTVDLDDERPQYLSRLVGTGIMKRDREGSQFLQGDGQWHLQEIMLTRPAMCVEWYFPPLLADGPFQLDGRVADEGDSVDVILSFQPSGGTTYHGVSICVDEDGNVGEGWSYATGGNESLAATIDSTYPLDGGTNQVEMKGKGIEMVESQALLEYWATLTLIPR